LKKRERKQINNDILLSHISSGIKLSNCIDLNVKYNEPAEGLFNGLNCQQSSKTFINFSLNSFGVFGLKLFLHISSLASTDLNSLLN
jgi:hypothetical protein